MKIPVFPCCRQGAEMSAARNLPFLIIHLALALTDISVVIFYIFTNLPQTQPMQFPFYYTVSFSLIFFMGITAICYQ